MKKLIITALSAAATAAAAAQSLPETGYDDVTYSSIAYRYPTREDAAAHGQGENDYRMKLQIPSPVRSESGTRYSFAFDMPPVWLERDIMLHTEGGRNSHIIYVNGIRAGSARDSRLPSSFDITQALKDGGNSIDIIITPDTDEPESASADPGRPASESVVLTARPRPGIEDVVVSAVPDSTGKHGILTVDIIVYNPYNYPEPITVGYDIYSPEKKLKTYDFREASVRARSRDTVRFEAPIYGTPERMWSASSPKLYDLTLVTRKNGIITEYIPLRIGFTDTEWNGEGLLRNGLPEELKPVRYNAPQDMKTAEDDLKGIKKRGYNAVFPDYPQPGWFYDLTDRIGLYVIDRANINSAHKPDGKQVGGTLANNPRWKDEYTARVKGMYYRSRNHPSVVAWALGAPAGNGYNMYKAYQWLHEQDSVRPVVFSGAAGEWNSDFELPDAVDFDLLPPLAGRRR